MLERVAVRRLESGGLQLFHGGRARKRALHSTFWVHGTGELDLATAAAALFGGFSAVGQGAVPDAGIEHQQQTANTAPRRVELVQLDFLYPTGALAFLRHLSTTAPRRNAAVFIRGGRREYSSSAQPVTPSKSADAATNADTETVPLTGAIGEASTTQPPSKGLKITKAFLDTAPSAEERKRGLNTTRAYLASTPVAQTGENGLKITRAYEDGKNPEGIPGFKSLAIRHPSRENRLKVIRSPEDDKDSVTRPSLKENRLKVIRAYEDSKDSSVRPLGENGLKIIRSGGDGKVSAIRSPAVESPDVKSRKIGPNIIRPNADSTPILRPPNNLKIVKEKARFDWFDEYVKMLAQRGQRPEDDTYLTLLDVIKSEKLGQYETVWYHYVDELYKYKVSGALKQRRRDFVVQYLLESSRRLEWTRALAVICEVPLDHWMEHDWENAVDCCIRLEMPDRALELLKENMSTKRISRNSGFEKFMAHYVRQGNWDLVMQAYRLLRGLEGDGGDRRHQLNTTVMPSMGEPSQAPKYIDEILLHTKTLPEQRRKWYRETPLEDELAEDLMKGCLSFITRPHAKWNPQWEDVWKTIKERKGWVLTHSMWERSLNYVAGTRQDRLATELYEKYRRTVPRCVPTVTMDKILLCYSRLQNFEGMRQLFGDIFVFSDKRLPDRRAYSIVMAATARRGDAEGVAKLMGEFMKHYPLESPQDLSHSMQVYATRGELEPVITQFNRIAEVGLKPDVVAYNILIHAYSKAGEVDGAARRVQEMLDAGLKPDDTTYNIIMNMCAMRGDVAGAENIFELAKQSGYQLSSYAYQSLAQAYVTAKELDKADQVLESIVDLEFTDLPTPIWNTVISAHAANNNLERVEQIFKIMSEKNIPFDYYTYGIVMHSLCCSNNMEGAENTLTYMKENDMFIDSDKYAILMVGYTRQGDFRKVWETFRRMLSDGIKADFKTLAVLLKSYAMAEVEEFAEIEGEAVHLASTESILDEVLAEARELDLNSFDSTKTTTPPWLFTPLINVYYHKNAWGRSIRLFERFISLSKDPKPNMQMYKSMMQVYKAVGDVDAVVSMWEGLKTTALRTHKGVSFRQRGRNSILELYRADICGALSIYMRTVNDIVAIENEIESLQSYGYVLDNVNWNDYVQALTLAGKLTKAAVMCERHLMSKWKEVRLYFFYTDANMRGEDGKVMPTVRPFVRTIEAIATELRELNERRMQGDPEAKAILIEIFRNAPVTWEACDTLEDMEGRAQKEMMYRLRRPGNEGVL